MRRSRTIHNTNRQRQVPLSQSTPCTHTRRTPITLKPYATNLQRQAVMRCRWLLAAAGQQSQCRPYQPARRYAASATAPLHSQLADRCLQLCALLANCIGVEQSCAPLRHIVMPNTPSTELYQNKQSPCSGTHATLSTKVPCGLQIGTTLEPEP
jgi:hypothetical protein